jgi:hypothetical protein
MKSTFPEYASHLVFARRETSRAGDVWRAAGVASDTPASGVRTISF